MEIKDFGEKIGGAKKDIWKSRNFSAEDLNKLSDEDILLFCKKDLIWKKPDYIKISKEKSTVIAYFTKKIRDSLPCTSKIRGHIYIKYTKLYVDFVSNVRDIVMQVSKNDDLIKLFDKIFVSTGYYTRHSSRVTCINTNPYIKKKALNAIWITDYDIQKAEVFFKNYTLDDVNPKKYIIKKDPNSPKYFIFYKKGKYYFRIDRMNFQNKDDAEKYIASGNLRKKSREYIKENISVSDIQRIGKINFQSEIFTDDFINIFKFRGGEFGNYETNTDRLVNLNYAFYSLIDLTYILNVSPDFLSFQIPEKGGIGLAFGSRGRGNAMAHYECLRRVINLTKMKGAGSLCHELFHALDHFLGQLAGNPLNHPFITELTWETDSISYEIIKSITALKNSMKYKEFSSKTYTNFFKECISLDQIRSKPYFSKIIEMAARCFSAYIYDKLERNNLKNDYLVYAADNKFFTGYKLYPDGKERENINYAFDNLFDTLKRELHIKNFNIKQVKKLKYGEDIKITPFNIDSINLTNIKSIQTSFL